MTQKLTAEKARQLLDELKAGGGIVATQPRRDLFVDAMELALLVLEAQECADTVGCGFVVCQPDGEPAHVADPSKVHLSFNYAGLGHGE